MIHSIFLLLAALVVFVLGGRFFARFLTLALFPPPDRPAHPPAHPEPLTPLEPRPEFADELPGHAPTGPGTASLEPRGGAASLPSWHRALPAASHYLAAVVTPAAITGAVTAQVWGWMPAYLWTLVGATLGGMLSLAALWLRRQYPGGSALTLARDLAGGPAGGLFSLLLLALGVACAGVFVVIAAVALSSQPVAATVFVLAVLAAALGQRFLVRRRLAIRLAGGLAFILAGLWLLAPLPLVLEGSLALRLGGSTALFVDGTVVSVLFLLGLAHSSARRPPARIQAIGGLVTPLLLLALMALLLALFIAHPAVVAPQRHEAAGAPTLASGLVTVLSLGAVAGLPAWIAFHFGITPGDGAHRDAAIGYNGASLAGLVALLTLLVVATGFADSDGWRRAYGAWVEVHDLRQAVRLFLDLGSQRLSGLGIGAGWAASGLALLLAALGFVALEATLRLLRAQVTDLLEWRGDGRPAAALLPGRRREALVALAVIATAFAGGATAFDGLWPHFGTLSLAGAAAWFSLAALALTRQACARPPLLVLLPALALWALTLWAALTQLVENLRGLAWLASVIDLAMLALFVALLLTLIARGLRLARRGVENGPHPAVSPDPAGDPPRPLT